MSKSLPAGARRARWRAQSGGLVAVAVGGAAGGAARYAVGLALAPGAGGWPWATFAVNVSGSFALAVLLALLLDATRPGRYLRPAAAIGFLGSFTTFAGWLVRVDRLAGDGRAGLAAAYLFASLAAGLAAVWLGLIAGRAMLRRRRGAS